MVFSKQPGPELIPRSAFPGVFADFRVTAQRVLFKGELLQDYERAELICASMQAHSLGNAALALRLYEEKRGGLEADNWLRETLAARDRDMQVERVHAAPFPLGAYLAWENDVAYAYLRQHDAEKIGWADIRRLGQVKLPTDIVMLPNRRLVQEGDFWVADERILQILYGPLDHIPRAGLLYEQGRSVADGAGYARLMATRELLLSAAEWMP